MTAAVIAHRGGVGARPGVVENSLEAFEAAIEAGAEMVELDIRRTAEGELIAFHDAKIARRSVGSLSRAEIAELSGHCSRPRGREPAEPDICFPTSSRPGSERSGAPSPPASNASRGRSTTTRPCAGCSAIRGSPA